MESAKRDIKHGVLLGGRVAPWQRVTQIRTEYPLQGAVEMLMRATRALGLAPVSLHRNGWGTVARVTRIPTVYCFLFLSFNYIVIMVGFLHDLYIPKISIASIVLWIINILLTFCVLNEGYGGRRRMRTLLSYLNDTEKVNEKFGSVLMSKSRDKQMRIMLMVILTSGIAVVLIRLFIIIAILTTGLGYWDPTEYYIFLNIFVRVVLVGLLDLQMLMVIKPILWTFQALNERLQILISEMKLKKGAVWSPSSVKVIRSAIEVYVSARDLAKQMNKSQGKTLMLLFSTLTLGIVNTTYYLISSYQQPDSIPTTIAMNGLRVLEYIYLSTCLIMLVEPCHETHVEMESTRELASELLSRATSAQDPLSNEVIRLVHQLELNTRVYSPLGLCTFSRGLYAGVFGGITTFMVIILQFKLKDIQ